MTGWIWQQPDWPHFHWRADAGLQPVLNELWRSLGMLLGRAAIEGAGVVIDDADASPMTLEALIQNIVTSSAIEGEQLNVSSVRSSLARRLGLAFDARRTTPRSEGVAELMLDAVTQPDKALTESRLMQWHQWLFPEGEERLVHINVGGWRGEGPMQVVSGRIDRPTVHFEAPPRQGLSAGIQAFLEWWQHSRSDATLDPLLRAAIAHLWFLTLHPFDDGNGRLARAIADLALAQADNSAIRLYAVSAQILERRSSYYHILEQTQKGGLDITAWLLWFLDTLKAAIDAAMAGIERNLLKARFWQHFTDTDLLPEQRKVVNRLLEGGTNGFESGISASQYQKVTRVSKATATRHLADLVHKGCLERLPAGGRSSRYQIKGGFANASG